MHDEGVIKFELQYQASAPLPWRVLRALNAWRSLLHQLGLIGQDPARYGGAGFGNVSRRLEAPRGDTEAQTPFAISGTRTGHLPCLDARHYARVIACDAGRNRVIAQGPVAPSSESLTHGMLYRLDPAMRYIFHVHAPAIWRRREALALPTTDPRVDYGTPAMAEEVARLYADLRVRRARVLAMGGHEDGIIAFGRSADQAGLPLVRLLARALV